MVYFSVFILHVLWTINTGKTVFPPSWLLKKKVSSEMISSSQVIVSMLLALLQRKLDEVVTGQRSDTFQFRVALSRAVPQRMEGFSVSMYEDAVRQEIADRLSVLLSTFGYTADRSDEMVRMRVLYQLRECLLIVLLSEFVRLQKEMGQKAIRVPEVLCLAMNTEYPDWQRTVQSVFGPEWRVVEDV